MTREQEILWLAGLLEGEGYFRFCYGTGRSRTNTQLGVVLQMTDKDIVERAARIMGAPSVKWTRRATENRKDTYRTQVCAERAAVVMREILPFMGERRKSRIEDVLRRWEEERQCRRSVKGMELFVVA